MPVTNNILQRTFRIRYGTSAGTCFTVDADGKRYLVTARHIVGQIEEPSPVDIMHDGIWKPVLVDFVGHGADDIDVSVLAPQQLFGASSPLTISVEMILSEAVYFLGFPYELSVSAGSLNQDFPFPLVKKAIVSGMNMDEGLILLDGHNNPGFSGAPVVREVDTSQVIGMVSGYRFERQHVVDSDGKRGPYTYHQNTGIVNVVSSKKINEIIMRNPVGISAA